MDILLGFIQIIGALLLCIGALALGIHVAIMLMVRQETGHWHWRWWSDEAVEDVTKPAHERMGIEPDHFARLQRGEIRLTFDCMVCGRVRDDDDIDVHYRPIVGMEEWFPSARVNVRYCNDNPVCMRVAHEPGPWDHTYENMKRGSR